MASKDGYKGWVTVTFGMSLFVVGLLTVSNLAGAVAISGSHQGSGARGGVPAGTISVTLTTNRSGNGVDYGASILLEVTPTGSSYTYSWSSLASSLTCPANENVSDLGCVDNYNGQAGDLVEVTVTDHGGDSGSASIELVLCQDPTVSQPTPSVGDPPSWTDGGQYYNLTSTITGGAYPIASHVTSPTGLNCTNSVSGYTVYLYCIPKTVGNYTVFVNITDADGFKASTRQTFQIYSAISVSASVSPSWNEVNQTFTLTATATGGNTSSGYSYNWGSWVWCSGGKTLTCKAPKPGVYQFSVSACNYPKYGSVCTLTRPSIWVNVNPGPSLTFKTPYGNATTVGSQITFDATASGGTGAYTYSYTGLPAGCPNQNASTWSCWPTATGHYSVKAVATDSLGFSANATLSVTVTLPGITFQVSRNVTLAGAQVLFNTTFTATPGSTATYTYIYTGLPAGCTSQDSSQLTCSPTRAGHYTIRVNATDGWGYTVSASVNLTVSMSLMVSAQVGSYNASLNGTLQDEAGATVTWNVSFAGGAPPSTCGISENGTAGNLSTTLTSTSTCTLTYSWVHGGVYLVTITVTDSSRHVISGWILVHVGQPLSKPVLTITNRTQDEGIQDNLSVSLSGGLPSYTYTWDFGNQVTKTTNHPYILFAWAVVGSYTVTLTVLDGTGQAVTTTATVTVVSVPTVRALSLADGWLKYYFPGFLNGTVGLPNGTTAWFNITVARGVGPFNITIWLEWAAPSGGHTPFYYQGPHPWVNISVPWKLATNYTMSISITDSEGGQVQTWLKLQVTDGHLSPVAITATHPAIDLGMWDNMTAGDVGQDGWGPYTFTWTLSRPGVASITLTLQTFNGSTTLNWQPPAGGTWNVSVNVVDMSGATVSAKASVMVNPDLISSSGCLSAAGDPQPGGNITVWWTCGAGILGTAPLSYAWTLDGKQTKTTVPEVSIVPDQNQPYPISLVVTDAVGQSVTYTTAVPTTPPVVTGATFTVLSQAQSGSTFNLSMRFHITTNDPDGQVVSYRVASSPGSISSQQWVPSEWTDSILLTGAGNHTIYIQVQDDSNRTSSLYQLVVSVTAPVK
ncbi:MAG: PKD domain-containing protein, partial [Nitrososphaerota archaeon]|nr:PKD domain-containing protein [Nitrososphaerota archaeon]